MCWKCKSNVEVLEPVSRSAECPVCHADLHSCRNCMFYSPGSHYDCHETIDELVQDKERANFCDSFKIKRDWSAGSGEAGSGAEDKSSKAKDAFNALFSI